MKRAAFLRNLRIPPTGWMHSKDSAGKLRRRFRPVHLWRQRPKSRRCHRRHERQYSWSVPARHSRLDQAHGRQRTLSSRSSIRFSPPIAPTTAKCCRRMIQRGCIGEYWHGNEPSHHIIYLYSYPANLESGASSCTGHDDPIRQHAEFPAATMTAARCPPGIFSPAWAFIPCARQAIIMSSAPAVKQAVMHLSNGKRLHHDRGKHFRHEHLHPIGQTKRQELGFPFLPLQRIEKRRHARIHDGFTAQQNWGTRSPMPN